MLEPSVYFGDLLDFQDEPTAPGGRLISGPEVLESGCLLYRIGPQLHRQKSNRGKQALNSSPGKPTSSRPRSPKVGSWLDHEEASS
jgi:hypothetical protein